MPTTMVTEMVSAMVMMISARVMPGARPACRLPPEVQMVWKCRPPFQGLRLPRNCSWP